MAVSHHTTSLQLAIMLCVAAPATAALNASDTFTAGTENSARPAEPDAQKIDWHEQPLHARSVDGSDTLAATVATPAVLAAGHAADMARQREDMNLAGNDPATRRFDLQDEEPLLNEHWWQALPGIAVGLFFGLVLYMRHPIQRKRKYRRTPHEPTGDNRRPSAH